MISSSTDSELHDWLRWAKENGSSFLVATAEAALLAGPEALRSAAARPARTEEGVAEASLRNLRTHRLSRIKHRTIADSVLTIRSESSHACNRRNNKFGVRSLLVLPPLPWDVVVSRHEARAQLPNTSP